jgi:hypothetical protein
MNASLPPTLTTHLLSVIAEPDPAIMARLAGVLARLDILPVQIYARLRQNVEGSAECRDLSMEHLEVDLYLSADVGERRERLAALLRVMVGVESVAMSS